MIILVNGKDVSVCIKDTDLMDGKKRFWAFFGAGYYDPQNSFKPVFGGADDVRRRLYEKYTVEYEKLLPKAEEQYESMRRVYEKKMAEKMESQPAPLPQGGGLGSQLEEIMLKVLAEQSVDKVVEYAKPVLDQHIKETFGVLPS